MEWTFTKNRKEQEISIMKDINMNNELQYVILQCSGYRYRIFWKFLKHITLTIRELESNSAV